MDAKYLLCAMAHQLVHQVGNDVHICLGEATDELETNPGISYAARNQAYLKRFSNQLSESPLQLCGAIPIALVHDVCSRH